MDLYFRRLDLAFTMETRITGSFDGLLQELRGLLSAAPEADTIVHVPLQTISECLERLMEAGESGSSRHSVPVRDAWQHAACRPSDHMLIPPSHPRSWPQETRS